MTKNKKNQTKAETTKNKDAAPDSEAAKETAAEDGVPAAAGEDAETESAPGEAGGESTPEQQVEELNDKLLRALAEAENVRRRAERDKSDAAKYAIANFARQVLGVADNMHRAMASVDADARKEDPALEQLMVGLEMTEAEMLSTFERFGIKPIGAMGEKFDHNLHEAMFELDDASKPAGTVVQVVEAGYVLNDRLLRPAKVGVCKGGPADKNRDNKKKTGAAKGATPAPAGQALKDGQTAYKGKGKGKEPGAQLDEEL
ncbi:MAG: nucleotide exchange factor GrpE [Rhodospirillaceae bacterium]|jgi:molecular chaperone GrpE|nr:nucleotide exchange factor GrpE [Rhodospirillaceae bacterium]|tara:strand:- start:2351 stop:3127 length:777 start_codon:yes stop_codon:yes gene_type:complete